MVMIFISLKLIETSTTWRPHVIIYRTAQRKQTCMRTFL